MASDSSQAPWRKSTFDPQKPLRGQKPWSSYRHARGRPSQASFSGNPRLSGAESLPPDRDLLENLHPTPIKTLARIPAGKQDENVRIEDYEYIGSYSWTGCETPTVIVPGISNMLNAMYSNHTDCVQERPATGSVALRLTTSNQTSDCALSTITVTRCPRHPLSRSSPL